MSDPAVQPRVVAGRYRLRSVLGSGSMGTVWSAYDEFLHRPVAVKEVRLPAGVPSTQADEVRERTLREARAIAVLSHPNVIILHDVAREHGDPFVVMELLPSRSLGAVLGDLGALDVPQAAAVADAVAAALEAAHAAGITHRDVKPGNVLVATDGRIKLTDFGIARNASEATMTRTGMMLGSPAYIAPEVASGGAVSPAADLWGLGATLFAAVEGHPPYDADGDALATVGKVVDGEVPAPADGPLASIISGLMTKDPTSRTSLREVRRKLSPLLTKPRHTLFPEELFTEGNVPAGRHDAIDTREIAAARPAAGPEEDGTGSPALAADPGPLPFATGQQRQVSTHTQPVRRSRGPGRTAVLAVASVVLFIAAGFGGFALTRMLGNQSLTPPADAVAEADPTAEAPRPTQPLVQRTGDATNLKGAKGGVFSVNVPGDWRKFVTQRSEKNLPPSTLVQFVSGDGNQVLGVQRYDGYFSDMTLDQYATAVEKRWPGGDFSLSQSAPLPEGREGRRLTYATVERSIGKLPSGRPEPQALSRTTFAEAIRDGDSLWVVGVTVPTDQKGAGRAELFEPIVSTFRPTN